jgi:hypothetical protein
LDTIIPPTHQARYKLNPNYAIAIKQYIDKLLVVRFIQFVEEVTWLSPIMIIPKKNGKLKFCIDFKKLNATTKKDPYPLPFTDEVLNIVTRYEAYSFFDGYLGYHQISIVLEDKYKTTFVTNWGAFIWKVMSFGGYDHMAFVYLVNKPHVSTRITKWLLLFLEYDFPIV